MPSILHLEMLSYYFTKVMKTKLLRDVIRYSDHAASRKESRARAVADGAGAEVVEEEQELN